MARVDGWAPIHAAPPPPPAFYPPPASRADVNPARPGISHHAPPHSAYRQPSVSGSGYSQFSQPPPPAHLPPAFHGRQAPAPPPLQLNSPNLAGQQQAFLPPAPFPAPSSPSQPLQLPSPHHVPILHSPNLAAQPRATLPPPPPPQFSQPFAAPHPSGYPQANFSTSFHSPYPGPPQLSQSVLPAPFGQPMQGAQQPMPTPPVPPAHPTPQTNVGHHVHGKRPPATVHATVTMISGCHDAQTSADVADITNFLSIVVGPEGAGGACTTALAYHLSKKKEWTWGQLLLSMRQTLKEKKYSQVPQLSSSHALHLDAAVHVKPPGVPPHRTKALLIGINYVGHEEGKLDGCWNDNQTWLRLIEQHGFDMSRVQLLQDDGQHTMPTRANIEHALLQLVEGAQAGDALFLQFSGHGSQIPDLDGDEEHGLDQVLIPWDYKTAGVIVDDWILARVVQALPHGVSLFCVMDCCHSGSIMDLPYSIAATANNVHTIADHPHMELPTNPNDKHAQQQQQQPPPSCCTVC